jgi:hypothetical protein
MCVYSFKRSGGKKNDKLVKDFYTERSKVVHGHQSLVSINLVEAMNKLLVLLFLTIANNGNLWKSEQELKNWCDDKKWGSTVNLSDSFPRVYLNRILELKNDI